MKKRPKSVKKRMIRRKKIRQRNNSRYNAAMKLAA